MASGSAFSHVTAAELYGLPVPGYAASSSLHVTVASPQRPPEGRGVVGHGVSPALWQVQDVVHLDPQRDHLFSIPTVKPALLWAQLAPVLDMADLVALGDSIVGASPALASIDDLRRLREKWGGSRGARSLAEAVEQIRVGSLSRAESLQRLQLVQAGLPEPQLNVRVEDLSGRLIAMADLAWPRYRLVLEYEGDLHRASKAKFRSDITRGEQYRDGGWYPMRSHAGDVFGDPNDLIGRVARRLRERGWQPARELRQVAAARP